MAKWTEEQKQAARDAYKAKMEARLNPVEEIVAPVLPPVEAEEEQLDREGSLGFLMSYQDKLQSMLNAVKILPPNLIKNGRHQLENVQALNCFKVTEKMMDEIYKDFKHEF